MKYLVLSRRTSQFCKEVLSDHYAFLERLRETGQLECAGPFTDRSGGAYLLVARSLRDARRLALADPLHIKACSDLEVFEWDVQ